MNRSRAISHYPRKRFGQHFLRDPIVIQQLVTAIAPFPTDHLVEIGAGQGVLSKELMHHTLQLDVIELDKDLIPYLEHLNEIQDPSLKSNITIYHADALLFNFKKLVKDNKPLRVVGNLPYNISTPLLFHLLEYASVIKDMHFMLQKEVVERITCPPGHKSYGRLSVMIQYHCSVEHLFDIGPEAFYPPPKVESSVIRLIPYQQNLMPLKDMTLFSTVVRVAFNQRRKTLRNNLLSILTKEQLAQLPIDLSLRPEQLSVADFVLMANSIADVMW